MVMAAGKVMLRRARDACRTPPAAIRPPPAAAHMAAAPASSKRDRAFPVRARALNLGVATPRPGGGVAVEGRRGAASMARRSRYSIGAPRRSLYSPNVVIAEERPGRSR